MIKQQGNIKTFFESDTKRGKKLHIGCANIAFPEWINLDGSWNAWLAKHPFGRWVLGMLRIVPGEQLAIQWPKDILVHDVRKGLPFPDGALSAIYASHLLEHLYMEEAVKLLSECFRVLEPGGIVRFAVPDLRSIVSEYLNGESSKGQQKDVEMESPADRLCRRLEMRPPGGQKGNILYRFYSTVKDFHTHKWMYDAESLRQHLSNAGFVNISQKSFLESEIPGIEEMEREGRFGGSSGICLEGIKPLVQYSPPTIK
jgi:predicted SAM-dependent methyltransferase